MSSKLQYEIGKKQPFSLTEEEASLALLRTADRLMSFCEQFLKSIELTATQYNVLRILRGMSPVGIACQEIARRMITRDADLTRLLDRLENRGLLERQRQTEDRRVVHNRITPAGLTLLAGLDETMNAMNKTVFGEIPRRRLSEFIKTLELVRQNLEPPKITA